ncbi:MAG TPA: outer membrane protein assembly factor BamA, partial [Chlamydiales bacterium]|nr:outer membrane protein assembly factor BamA [Chlamydiales bacterium]
ALSAAESYEQKPIQAIEISTGKTTDPAVRSATLSRLKTKTNGIFSQTDFDEDLKMLAKENERVEPKVEVVDGKLKISLLLVPKPTIRELRWNGVQALKPERLEKELGIHKGSVFDRESFTKAFHKVKAYYIKKGYFEAELDYKVELDEPVGLVDVDIDVKEGRSGKIREIQFHNFTKKEIADLEDTMITKEYWFLTSWATGEGTMRPEVVQHDELQVINYLRNRGYADATVETKVEELQGKDRIILHITAKKGDVYHVGAVTIDGNELFQDKELFKHVPFKKGDLYSPDKVNEAIKAISELYGKKGYVDLQVLPQANLIDGKVYDVHFQIEEGRPFRVGLIKVFGNTRTEAAVILHEMLLVPGELFDGTMLAKSEERLKNTGYFTNVNVYAVKSKHEIEGNLPFRDVQVEVEENPTTGSFKTFFGYSTSERLMGGFSISETNFNMKGIPQIPIKGTRALRGGGEYFGFEAAFGTRQRSYTLSWTKPYFLDTQWTVGVDLQRKRNSYAWSDYTIKTNSMRLFGHYAMNAFVSAEPHYRLTHSFIRLKGIHHTRRNHELIHESRNGGLISALGINFVYDSRNHPMMPTAGLRSTLGGEYAGLGGDHTFGKLNYLNSYFFSPYKGGVLLLRGNLQFIKTLGSTDPRDLPLAERLYVGGESTIRGYVFNSVGPKFHDKRRTVRGGMSEVLLSAEFTQYLAKKVDAFVFFDAGNVYFKEFHLGQLRASYGFGIKLKISPQGAPLVIGLGFPINPAHKDDVRPFFLSFNTSF